MHPLPQTGVLTFVFTDVEGSTARWDRAPDAMAQALSTHDQILSDTFASYGGTIFKRVGDAFCCAFSSPVQAVTAALAIQRKLAGQPWEQAIGELRVRIGIHTGLAICADDDYFGPALNRVARLTSAGHGGQILLSAATAALVRGQLPAQSECRNLGTHRLRDLAEPETIYQLGAVDLEKDYPQLRTLDARPNNLPSELSSFVGRETELRELRELLGQHRLVTIAGPGGIGKTRLALQLAAELLEVFDDGIWFVAFAATSDPSLVWQTIAAALGVTEAAAEPIETTVSREIARKKLLLVFDNAEHLLQPIAHAAHAITDRAPEVRIVATSGEPLHLAGEHVYRLGSVDEQAAERLFIERAQAVAHDFSAVNAGSEDLAVIARSLQGIPLAIELAAARVSILSLRQIRERLDTQLSLLRSPGAQDDRHRTLRKTIAWSYELLGDRERAFLGTLSVFCNGFTLDAVETITPERDALDVLEALVDKSFVAVARAQSEIRYNVLDAIGEYAAGEADQTVLESARAKHFQIYSALAAKGMEVLPHEALRDWLDAVDADLANLRAALSHGFENRSSELGRMLLGMWRYWYIRRTVKEGRSWLRRYIDRAPETDPDLPGILRHAGTFASIEGAYEDAEALAKRALTMYHGANDEAGILGALHTLAVNENRRGDYVGAEKLYGDIAARCTQAGQERAALISSANRAALQLQRGELDAAEMLLSQCRRQSQQVGDDDVHATVLALHGTLAYGRRLWEEAERQFRQALALKRELKNDFGVAEISAALAAVRTQQMRLDEAFDFVHESLEIALRLDALVLIVNSLEVYALAQLHRPDVDAARDCFALSLAIRRIHALNHKIALGRDEVEAELRRRFGAELEACANAAMSGDWKLAARALYARLGDRSEISFTS